MNLRASINFLLLFALSSVLNVTARGQETAITPPNQREISLSQAKKIMSERSGIVNLAGNSANPFILIDNSQSATDLASADSSKDSAPPEPKVDLLAQISTQIRPSGTMNLGGSQIIIIGQKKLKNNQVYIVALDGKEYQVIIKNITSNSFTFQLGDKEFTRPIVLPTNK